MDRNAHQTYRIIKFFNINVQKYIGQIQPELSRIRILDVCLFSIPRISCHFRLLCVCL